MSLRWLALGGLLLSAVIATSVGTANVTHAETSNNTARMISTNMFISVFNIPGTLLHISLLICIVHAMAIGSKEFRSGFYVLFCVVTTLDVLQVVLLYLTDRLRECDYFPGLYEGNRWLGHIDQVGEAYIELCQFLGHLLMSANRFTVFVFPLQQDKLWQGKHLFLSVLGSLLLPVPLVSVRFGYDFNYVHAGDGHYTFAFMPREYTLVSSAVSAIAIVIATTISLLLDLIVVVKVRKILLPKPGSFNQYQANASLRNDIRLLISTLVTLCAHVLLAACHVGVFLSAVSRNFTLHSFIATQYTWISDSVCLIGSPALLGVSSVVRSEYVRFYCLSELPRLIGATSWTTPVESLR